MHWWGFKSWDLVGGGTSVFLWKIFLVFHKKRAVFRDLLSMHGVRQKYQTLLCIFM